MRTSRAAVQQMTHVDRHLGGWIGNGPDGTRAKNVLDDLVVVEVGGMRPVGQKVSVEDTVMVSPFVSTCDGG